MRNKTFNKLLLILMITMLLAADFLTLSYNLISYAAETGNATNHQNIEFSAYFKNDESVQVTEISQSMQKQNMKLYVKVNVKNEGYFNGQIEIQNSNFKFKNTITSQYVKGIEDSKVELNKINAGNSIEVELYIEPIIAETISVDKLSCTTDVKLTGTYMEASYKGLAIEGTKNVKLNLKPDETTEAELSTEIITNSLFEIESKNKRIVQLLVKSRLKDNVYPIKQTTLNVTIPQLNQTEPEQIQVFAMETKATNGQEDVEISNWKKVDGNIQIILENKADEQNQNQISWCQNAYDEIIVTYIYDAGVDTSDVNINATSKIQVYNSGSEYTPSTVYQIVNKEPNNIITNVITSNISEIYKGQLYANINSEEKKNIEYDTTTTIGITNLQVADEIQIQEGNDKLKTATQELQTKTMFIKTEIDKEQLSNILGSTGVLQIDDGTTVYNITKNIQEDDNGKVIINYTNQTNQVNFTITNYEGKGKLELKHTKAILPNTYTRKQIKNMEGLQIKNTLTATSNRTEVIKNAKETKIELKETVSKATLTVNKLSWSTMTTNEDVILGIKLRTDNVKYDLYKNPTIQVKFPEVVESVAINGLDVLYADNFIKTSNYNDRTKTLNITLTGEQINYPTDAEQLYIQINADITLAKTTPSKTDTITVTYTNENATQYDNGITEKGVIERDIQVSSINGLVTMHNLSTYDLTGIKGTSNYEQKIQLSDNEAGKDIKFEIGLINNTQTDLSNIRIVGILPTIDNEIDEKAKNTLETQLMSVNAPNATVYYTNNASATYDIEKTENGWTSDLNNVTNPKLYLIQLQAMPVETNYFASYIVRLPNTLGKDLLSYAQYKVVYDNATEQNIEKTSVIYGFETETKINLETTITAEVGNDILQNGDTIKAGEVIRYKATVKNNGLKTIDNVKLTAIVPDGTVHVTPEEDYVYSGISYYDENTEIKDVTEIIKSLEPNETYSFEYEVRAKSDIEEDKEIVNKATASCNNINAESEELRITVKVAKIRVTIKRAIDLNIDLVAGTTMKYIAFIENLSDEAIKNLNIQIVTENQDMIYILNPDINLTEIPEKLSISELPANGSVYYHIATNIKENVESISAVAVVTDSKGEIYRSNKTEEALVFADAEISMSSPQDKQYIKQGDAVEYNITVKNTGNIDTVITIIDNVSEYLKIQQISVNGEIISQSLDRTSEETYISKISNEILYKIFLKQQEQAEMKIIAKVRNLTEEFEVKNITNKAEVEAYGKVKDTSEEIIHILKGNTTEDIKNVVSGTIWLDENVDGIMQKDEGRLSKIVVRLYDISANDYVRNNNGEILETISNENGEYTFTKIQNGKYIVLFQLNTEEYEPTIYEKEGVEESKNSNIVLKEINIAGEEKTYGVTDTIDLSDNVININAGLKEKVIFDLELNKYISKITVQKDGKTKSYSYENSTFERVEIKAKQIEGAVVVLEYTIRVKNNGEIAGTVNNIVDYLPNGLTFNSELNPSWYLLENKLFTKALENEEINPGEEKEVKLILTKIMSGNNVGLINNSAEIYQSYNGYGNEDIDSKENNQVKEEDDYGVADVIIGISTGGTTILYTILVIINTALIGLALYMIFQNKKIPVRFWKERR